MDRHGIDVDLRFAPTATLTARYLNEHRDPKTAPILAKDLIPSTAKDRAKRDLEFRRQKQIAFVANLKHEQDVRLQREKLIKEKSARPKNAN